MKISILTTFPDSLLRAKLTPLTRARRVDGITLVCDEAGPALSGVRYVVPTARTYRWSLHKAVAKLLALWSEARRDRPDLVMAYTLFPHGFSALLISRLIRRPVAVHLTGGYVELTVEKRRSDNSLVRALPMLSGLIQAASRWVIRRADFVMVPGSVTRSVLVNEIGVADDRIIDLHSTIDVDRFTAEDDDKEYDLILVAKLRGLKRGDVFLEVVRRLTAKLPDIRAVIVGDGEAKADLESMAEAEGLGRHVDFVGYQSDPRTFLNRSRVFLLPSVAEGISTAVMEGMACGVPAVATDVGDMRDIVINDVTGYVLPEGASPAAYADAAYNILGAPDSYPEFSRNCRQLIVTERSFTQAEAAWNLFLDRFPANGQRPDA